MPGAIPVPLATVPDELDDFPTEGPVYVICAAGGRSRRAAEFLRNNGVDAVNVAGGTRPGSPRGTRQHRPRRRLSQATDDRPTLITTAPALDDLVADARRRAPLCRSTPSSTASAPTTRKVALVQIAWEGGIALDRPAGRVPRTARQGARPAPASPSCTQRPRTSRCSTSRAAPCPRRLFDTQLAAGFLRHVHPVARGARRSRAAGAPAQGRPPHRLAGAPAQRADQLDLRRLRRRPPPRARTTASPPDSTRPVAAQWAEDECEELRAEDARQRDPERRAGGASKRSASSVATPVRRRPPPRRVARRAGHAASTCRCASCSPDLAIVAIAQRAPRRPSTSSIASVASTCASSARPRSRPSSRSSGSPSPTRRPTNPHRRRARAAARPAPAVTLVSAWVGPARPRARSRPRAARPRAPTSTSLLCGATTPAVWPSGWRADLVGETDPPPRRRRDRPGLRARPRHRPRRALVPRAEQPWNMSRPGMAVAAPGATGYTSRSVEM